MQYGPQAKSGFPVPRVAPGATLWVQTSAGADFQVGRGGNRAGMSSRDDLHTIHATNPAAQVRQPALRPLCLALA